MNLTGRLILLAALLGQLPPASPAPSSADAQPFVLGVLRRDGVVTPFASFDGKDWTAPWPEDLFNVELPISSDGIPRKWWGKPGPQASMTLWSDGTARGSVQLEQPVRMAWICTPRIALKSTYHSAEIVPPPLVRPYPKEGIVVSGAQRVEPIEAVPRTSDEWLRTAVTMIDPAEAAEQFVVQRIDDWRHPVPRKERKKVPLKLEALYKAPMDEEGWTAYYLEAIKEYPPGPDDEGCGLVTSISGWNAIGPKGKHWALLYARVTYCDREGVGYMLPFGRITTNGRTYWVYQISSYDGESYFVTRPTEKTIDVEVSYSGGYCPRPRGLNAPSFAPSPSPRALLR